MKKSSSASRPHAGSGADAPAPDAEAKRSTYHHGNLRDALVMRGIEILDAQGLAALSLRQAARDVGVSQTAPLHHFEGKSG